MLNSVRSGAIYAMRTAIRRVLLTITASFLACGITLTFAQANPAFSELNPFDNFRPSDYESLLADALIAVEDGRYSEAKLKISDALQIIKVNHGLLSTEQFPALQLLAATLLDQNDWPAFDQHLAYFEWLLRKLSVSDFSAYLSGTQVLNSLYLEAAALPNNPSNAHYLVAAKQLNWRAVTAIESRYDKDSLSLAPWLYNIVLTHYYQSALTRRKGISSYDYKSNTPDIVSGWALTKNESLEQSYGIGQELLSRIRTLYANSDRASPATDALMLIYMADWEILFDRSDAALKFYNAAYELVKNTGADSSTLQSRFAHPVIIPVNTFSDTWPQSDGSKLSTLNFAAWSPVFPGVHRPEHLMAQARQTVGEYSALARLEFSQGEIYLASGTTADTNRFSFVITNLDIETIAPDNDLVASQARQQIAELRFRPLVTEGMPDSENNFHLNYVFAAETDFSMLSDAN